MTNKLICSVIECPTAAGEFNASGGFEYDGVTKFPNFEAYAPGGCAAMLAAAINNGSNEFNGVKLRAVSNGNSLVVIGVAKNETPTAGVIAFINVFPDAADKTKWTNAEIVNPYTPGVTFTAQDVATRFAAGCVTGAVLGRSFT